MASKLLRAAIAVAGTAGVGYWLWQAAGMLTLLDWLTWAALGFGLLKLAMAWQWELVKRWTSDAGLYLLTGRSARERQREWDEHVGK